VCSSHANIPLHLCHCTDGVAQHLHRPPSPPICVPDGVLVCRSSPGCPLPPGTIRPSPTALSPVSFHLCPQKNLLESLPQRARKDSQRSQGQTMRHGAFPFRQAFKSSPRQQQSQLLSAGSLETWACNRNPVFHQHHFLMYLSVVSAERPATERGREGGRPEGPPAPAQRLKEQAAGAREVPWMPRHTADPGGNHRSCYLN